MENNSSFCVLVQLKLLSKELMPVRVFTCVYHIIYHQSYRVPVFFFISLEQVFDFSWIHFDSFVIFTDGSMAADDVIL